LSDIFSSIGHFISTYWRPIVAIIAAIATYGIATYFEVPALAAAAAAGGLLAASVDGLASADLTGLQGGNAGKAFWFALGASAAFSIYESVTPYQPTTNSGGNSVLKDPGSPNYNPAPYTANNIGVAHPAEITGFWATFIPKYEGNWFFKILNHIPGFNSFATFHDWLLYDIGASPLVGTIINFPSMVPAMATNYAALLDGIPAYVLANQRDDH
jgi:hypothetical protein